MEKIANKLKAKLLCRLKEHISENEFLKESEKNIRKYFN